MLPTAGASPSAAHYQVLRRLRRMVLRSEGAVLIYLWGDDPRTADWLQQQLDHALRPRSRRVLRQDVTDDTSLRAGLDAVLAPPAGCEHFTVWVRLPSSADGWPLADQWLARANERRLQLLQPPRALLVSGPTAYEARAGEVAPDLWSVRSDSLQLPPWDDGSSAAASSAGSAVVPASWRPTPLLELWRQAWGAAQRMPSAERRLDIGLGIDAAQRLLKDMQFAAARQVIDELGRALADLPAPLEAAAQRQRLQLAWLSGDWFGAQRRWPEAQAAHAEAEALCARHLALTPDAPEALRDWSVSLIKVGDVQRALGDVAGARGRYEESLKVSERLVALTGESPEALRDWSVSLEKVGDVQRALGDVAGAQGRYEESLKVSERLVALTGESPEALRDWSVSLNKVGDVQRALGDVAGARGRYEESLKVRERLVALTGESPEALRDLLVSLGLLGDLHRDLKDFAIARGCYRRCLATAEAALRQSPLSKELQDDVARTRARLDALPPETP